MEKKKKRTESYESAHWKVILCASGGREWDVKKKKKKKKKSAFLCVSTKD
jgi:hypothetical protein